MIERRRGIADGLGAALPFLLLAGCGNAQPETLALGAWDLNTQTPSTSRRVQLPAKLDGELTPNAQTYRLTTRVIVPPVFLDRECAVVVPHLWATVVLKANGHVIPADRSAWFGSYRTAGPHRFLVPASDLAGPELELELEVHHEWSQSGWLEAVPYLSLASSPAAPDRRYLVGRTFAEYGNAVGVGACLMISFAYGVLFVLDRRRRTDGWFSLQGASATFYLLFDMGATQALFGVYDTPVVLISLVVAVIASVYYTRSQFRLSAPSALWPAVAVACLVAALAGRRPFVATRVVAPATIAVIACVIVYQFVVIGRLALQRSAPRNARVALSAWIVLATFTSVDIAAWLGLGEGLGGIRTACVGVSGFAILQSVALGSDFVASLRRVESLNEQLHAHLAKLAEQQSHVSHLNEELRRQVFARSEQLSDALTRLANARGSAVVLVEGAVVEGKYRVARAIGSGGMGVVYEARRIGDEMRVALKLLAGFAGIRELARFAREGKLAATIDHPNVVKIYDAAVAKEGFLFLALEYVDGEPLSRCRDRYGDVPWAVAVLEKVARGLAAIHEKGVVHRDLKPANILVSRRHDQSERVFEVKITDFGISTNPESDAPFAAEEDNRGDADGQDDACPDTGEWKIDERGEVAHSPSSAEPLTSAGALLGTPQYMAPEALRGGAAARPEADVYSFGVMAFELVHRRRPSTPRPDRSSERPEGEPITAAHPQLERRLSAAIDAALDPAPERRPTAAELVIVFCSPLR